VAFEPVDFVARLAALVPKPRVNLTRYHGVLAPNHRWRGLVKVNGAQHQERVPWGTLPLFAGKDSSTTALHSKEANEKTWHERLRALVQD
jgi:hypothetical protein